MQSEPPAALRAVADTNVVISGLLWRGVERNLLEAARAGKIILYTSAALLAELADVLPREKFSGRMAAARMSVERLTGRYARLARSITAAEIKPTLLADPDDDTVIACALAARADIIVSGDKRLRNLKNHQGIDIVTAAEALKRLPQR